MPMLADDFGAWLVAVLADAGRRRLAAWMFGDDQERALRKAAEAAVELTSLELRPEGGHSAEDVARVVDQVFTETMPPVALAGHATVLQALQVGVVQQLAVLDDKSITDTDWSSSDVLGIPGSVLAEVLTRHLLKEIVARGSHGEPLESLANQLNHDATHLQNQRAEAKIDQLDEKLRAVLTLLADIPIATDHHDLISRFIPPALYQILDRSPQSVATAELIFSRYCGLLDAPADSLRRKNFTAQCDNLLRVAMTNVQVDAFPLLSGRDVTVLFALASHLTYCAFLPISVLADLISADRRIRINWIQYVDSIKKMPPRKWSEISGDADGTKPDVDALNSLSFGGMARPENFAVALYRERQYCSLSSATIRTGRYSAISSSVPELFPGFWNICSAVLAALDAPSYVLTAELSERLSGLRVVAGCHVLYLAMLVRAAISVRRLIEIADDEVPMPVRALPSNDHRVRTIQRQVTDIQPENQDGTEVLGIVCAPDSPRLLARVREEVGSVRQVVDQCTATLAQYYLAGPERALRLRYPRIRSSVDDPYRYVRERSLPFYPELARLAMDAEGILPLLVRPLYGNAPAIGIRELLQNSLDAVSARDAIEKGTIRYTGADDMSQSRITITVSDGTQTALSVPSVPPPADWVRWLEVRDTGVGMTSEVIREHFMAVGGSFDPVTDSYDWDRKGPRLTPRSGRFGVGVLASFLLGNELQVITRHISSAEHEGIYFQLAEYADEAELSYCRAPIGTTARVKLDAATADQLVADPDGWDWFQYTEPSVTRASINAGDLSFFQSTLPPLDPSKPSDPWRKLTVPPYGDVFWTPSAESYRSQIFINGIRIVSLHRNFNKNIMEPVEQLKQPVISIVDRTQSCELKLTRDGFIDYPDTVFEAVRRDAIADHIAWLLLNAQRGLDQQLQWESEIWEEKQYTSGSGDGVTRAIPFLVTKRGIIPLHPTLLREAGIEELDFFLTRAGLVTNAEMAETPFKAPRNTVRALSAYSGRLGHPVGALHVDMFGGFGFSPLAAGIQETFRFAGRIGSNAEVQIVTLDRGTSYAEMYKNGAIRTWNNELALADERSRSYIITGPGDHEGMEEREREIQRMRREGIQTYMTSLTDDNDTALLASRFREIFNEGYYGLMHVWLAESNLRDDEFLELWRNYQLPALLPFGLVISSLRSLPKDFPKRIQRLSIV
jgi:hypothetical protein